MAKVIFYGKPGCGGNTRQKKVLAASGHEIDDRDVFSTPWTSATLLEFLGDLPVTGWFHPNASRVKSGEISPETLSREQAMALLLGDIRLIRRPLLESGGVKVAGWNPERLSAWIGLADTVNPGPEACPGHDHDHDHHHGLEGHDGGCRNPMAHTPVEIAPAP